MVILVKLVSLCTRVNLVIRQFDITGICLSIWGLEGVGQLVIFHAAQLINLPYHDDVLSQRRPTGQLYPAVV